MPIMRHCLLPPGVDYPTGVYVLMCHVSHKIYVGGAYESFDNRFRSHEDALRRGTHFNRHLQSAWNLYGYDEFSFNIVEKCSLEEVQAREQHWIDSTGCLDREIGYNLSPMAGSVKGIKHSEETKKKFSDGAKRRLERPEERDRLLERSKKGAAKNKEMPGHFTGHNHTEETKSKLSAMFKGNKQSIEHIEKRMSKLRGRPMSDEQKEKQRVSHTGKKASEETKRKMSESAKKVIHPKGGKASEETKSKMSESQKAAWQDEEVRNKRVAGMQGRVATDEARKNMSECRIGVPLKEHHIEALKRAWAEDKEYRSSVFRASWDDPEKREARMKKLHETYERKRQEKYLKMLEMLEELR